MVLIREKRLSEYKSIIRQVSLLTYVMFVKERERKVPSFPSSTSVTVQVIHGLTKNKLAPHSEVDTVQVAVRGAINYYQAVKDIDRKR